MAVYQKKNHGGRLEFVDISATDFNPTQYGMHLTDFMYQMHAIDNSGKIYRGVEGFWAIWQAFPTSTFYGLLGKLVISPGLGMLARTGYRCFAHMRRYLPKRKKGCESGVCRIRKQ